MPGLNTTSATLVDSQQPYPTSVVQLAARLRALGQVDLGQALLTLQKSLDDIHRILRQNPPVLKDLTVDGRDGRPVVRLGDLQTADGRIFYGAQVDALYAGDPLNTGDPAQAVFSVTPDGHVQIGAGGWMDVLDPFGADAAWLGAQFDTLPVTNSANNGAGLIRLTVTGHTLLTGDKPRILNVGGVPNARGIFTVTKINANTLDLQNSVFDGTYTSGGTVDRIQHVAGAANNGSGLIRLNITAHGYESGDQVSVLNVPNATQHIITVIDADHFDLRVSTWSSYTANGIVLRYAAGGQFENISIGPSFWSYLLRAFPDGTLKIKNALITLDSLTGKIVLDPTVPDITIKSKGLTPEITTTLEPGIINMAYDDNSDGVQILPTSIELDTAGVATLSLDGPSGGITGKQLNISGATINTSKQAAGFAWIDALAYKVGGTFGDGVILTVITGVDFTLQTVTTKTLTFNSGILMSVV